VSDADTNVPKLDAGHGALGHSWHWSSLTFRLALLIVVLLAVSAAATATFAAMSVRSNEARNADESMANVHESTELSINQVRDDVQRYRETALASRKQLLKDLTMAQTGALDHLRAAVDRGDMSLAAANTTAKEMLFDYRYGLTGSDYFFVFTPDMVSIVEPNPTFRGDEIDYRDPNGKSFFRDFRAVANGPGEGYVDYVANRVGQTTPSGKISFVYNYKPWQWVIGTGVYVDDIDAEANNRLETAKQELSASLKNIEFSGSGFFFVLDKSGNVVAAPSDHDLAALGETTNDGRLADHLVAAAPAAGSGIARVDTSARLQGSSDQNWRFDVSTVASQDWVLVSAVPLAQLNSAADQLALRQIMLCIAVLLFGLAIGVMATRRMIRPVRDLTDAAIALEEERFDPKSLDAAAGRKDEVGSLARAFRRMSAEVLQRERKLREKVSRLQVVVDQKKVEDSVAEIADSDFFRDLEEQAKKMRESD